MNAPIRSARRSSVSIRLALDVDAVADAAMLVEADSEGAARDGLLPEQLIDRYLSTLWAIWEVRAAGDPIAR